MIFKKIILAVTSAIRDDDGNSRLTGLWFVVVFTPLVMSPFLADMFELPKALVFMLGTWASFLFLLKKGRLIKDRSLIVVLGTFALVCLLSVVQGFDVVNGWFGLYGRYTSSILFLFTWLIWVFIVRAKAEVESRAFWWRSLLVVGGVVALWGLIQQSGFTFYEAAAEGAPRGYSFFGNPNFSSMFLAALLPLGLHVVVRANSWKSKGWYLTLVFLMAWSMAAFSSRGALLAAAIGLVVWFGASLFRRSIPKWLYLVPVVLAIVIVPVYSSVRPDSVAATFALNETTVESRFLVWDAAIQLIQQRPLLGGGLGNFYIGFKQLGLPTFATGDRFDDGHNIFLHLGVDIGLLGLGSFLLILALAAQRFFRALKSLTKESDVMAIGSSLVALLVGMSFNPVSVANWMMFGLLLGCLFYAGAKDSNILKFRWAIFCVALVFPIVYLWYLIGLGVTDYLVPHARLAYKQGEFAKALQMSSLAHKFMPFNLDAENVYVGSSIRLGVNQDAMTEHIEYIESLHPESSGGVNASKNLWFLAFRKYGNTEYAARALSATDELVAKEPNFSRNLVNASYMNFLFGRPEEGVEYAKQVLVLDPQDYQTWILLAKMYGDLGQYPQAHFALKKAYLADPLAWEADLLWRINKDKPKNIAPVLSLQFPDFDIH